MLRTESGNLPWTGIIYNNINRYECQGLSILNIFSIVSGLSGSAFYRVQVGIGVGIDSRGLLHLFLMDRVASLTEFRQHRHDAGQQGFAVSVFLSRKGTAPVQDILKGAALERRTSDHLKIAPLITVGRIYRCLWRFLVGLPARREKFPGPLITFLFGFNAARSIARLSSGKVQIEESTLDFAPRKGWRMEKKLGKNWNPFYICRDVWGSMVSDYG
ncbi:hypothetical protein JW992_12635 [candidate division KSB1 bacterium]|nr:hypothetical protein [candidate division KSB1 bacterium]